MCPKASLFQQLYCFQLAIASSMILSTARSWQPYQKQKSSQAKTTGNEPVPSPDLTCARTVTTNQ